MKRFLINVYTNWCGEEQTYAAFANDDSDPDLNSTAGSLAYGNFAEFDGFNEILRELYPEIEEGEYTDEQNDFAVEVEGEYYGYNIEEWDETRDIEEWNWYELVYDANDFQDIDDSDDSDVEIEDNNNEIEEEDENI